MNVHAVEKAYNDMIAESGLFTYDSLGSGRQFAMMRMEDDEIPRTLESLVGRRVMVWISGRRGAGDVETASSASIRVTGKLERRADAYQVGADLGTEARFTGKAVADVSMDTGGSFVAPPDVVASICLK